MASDLNGGGGIAPHSAACNDLEIETCLNPQWGKLAIVKPSLCPHPSLLRAVTLLIVNRYLCVCTELASLVPQRLLDGCSFRGLPGGEVGGPPLRVLLPLLAGT